MVSLWQVVLFFLSIPKRLDRALILSLVLPVQLNQIALFFATYA